MSDRMQEHEVLLEADSRSILSRCRDCSWRDAVLLHFSYLTRDPYHAAKDHVTETGHTVDLEHVHTATYSQRHKP